MVESSEETQSIADRMATFFSSLIEAVSYVPVIEEEPLILTEEGERIIEQRVQRLNDYFEEKASGSGLNYLDGKIADFNRRFT